MDKDYRKEPSSFCYGCVNFHWGCPATSWDENGNPLKNGKPFAIFCYTGKDDD